MAGGNSGSQHPEIRMHMAGKGGIHHHALFLSQTEGSEIILGAIMHAAVVHMAENIAGGKGLHNA